VARFAYWPWNVRIRCSLSRSGCVCDRGREKIRLASDEFCLFSRGDLSVILLRACVVSYSWNGRALRETWFRGIFWWSWEGSG